LKWSWMEDNDCLICGTEDVPMAYAKALPYPYKNGSIEPLFWQLIYHECPECGLRFMSPRPNDASYERYYSTMEYRNASARILTPDEMDHREKVRARRYETDLENVPYKSHLDIGCSRGYLLDMSKSNGASVIGVEPNRDYTVPGIPTVSSIDDVEGRFDLVTCIHVLEHVTNPKHVADRMIELTKPGGVVVVEVPKDDPVGLSSGLSHPYAFQPKTIKRLFPDFDLLDYKMYDHPVFVLKKLTEE
jgi:SAM-dependent methyltransferase